MLRIGSLMSDPVAVLALVFAGLTLLMNLGQQIFGGGWNLSKNLAEVELHLTAAIEEECASLLPFTRIVSSKDPPPAPDISASCPPVHPE